MNPQMIGNRLRWPMTNKIMKKIAEKCKLRTLQRNLQTKKKWKKRKTVEFRLRMHFHRDKAHPLLGAFTTYFFRSSGSILIRAAHPIFNDKLSRSRKSTKLFEYFFFFKLKCICGFERKCWQCKHSPLASLKCNYSFFFAFVVVASRCADAMCRLCQNHT